MPSRVEEYAPARVTLRLGLYGTQPHGPGRRVIQVRALGQIKMDHRCARPDGPNVGGDTLRDQGCSRNPNARTVLVAPEHLTLEQITVERGQKGWVRAVE